jgi:hypothetical protein
MGRKRKNKVIDREEQRYGLFMNEKSFNIDVMFGRNYLKTDVVHRIKVYKVNVIESKSHALYGQAKASDKKYFAPVAVDAMITVEDQEQSFYGNSEGGIVRDDTGPITVGIYLDELKEKKLEVDRGDIIEYNMSGERDRYYEVENAQNVVDSTSQTIAGFKPYWRQITAVPVKEDITPYLKGDSLR